MFFKNPQRYMSVIYLLKDNCALMDSISWELCRSTKLFIPFTGFSFVSDADIGWTLAFCPLLMSSSSCFTLVFRSSFSHGLLFQKWLPSCFLDSEACQLNFQQNTHAFQEGWKDTTKKAIFRITSYVLSIFAFCA